MKKKLSLLTFLFILIMLIILIFSLTKVQKKNKIVENINESEKVSNLNENIILNVKYISEDKNNNRYIVTADKGKIDLSNNNIVFLTNVRVLIELQNQDKITINSDFGKYNMNTYDTILNENIVVHYLDNKIIGELLELSMEKNLFIISKNVIFTSPNNSLEADAAQINIITKDGLIYMNDKNKKVIVKNIN